MTYQGKSISNGISVGKTFVFSHSLSLNNTIVSDVNEELSRLEIALEETKSKLTELSKNSEMGEILEIHAMLLEDEDFLDEIKSNIRDKKYSAEFAVKEAGNKFSEIFSQLDDEYMRERASDILEVSKELIGSLSGNDCHLKLEKPSILITDEISPEEIINNKDNLLGLVVKKGSLNSHASILVRSFGIPSVIYPELEINNFENGTNAMIDCEFGILKLDPTDEEVKSAKEKSNHRVDIFEKYSKSIDILANISSPEEVKTAIEKGANGIGLFRSEFLFINRTTLPSEDEQFEAFKEALLNASGKQVVIRTMDIGADKKTEAIPLDHEENPSLGLRGIRLSLEKTDIFRTQLRALLRASLYGNLSIMYPMITNVFEVVEAKKTLMEEAENLKKQGVPFTIPSQGIMIETPAAALISDELSKLVDFFSIGTNDLTQYTLAADRENPMIMKYSDPHHDAIFKLIKITCDNAHKERIKVCVCGELAKDITIIDKLIECGVDEISI